jgi:hypothetical protein
MAHEGEELVIALPAVMLGAAFFILKWAAQPEDSAGEVPVEPPDEAEPADHPQSDHGQVQVTRQRLAEGEHQQGEGEHAEDEQDPLCAVET